LRARASRSCNNTRSGCRACDNFADPDPDPGSGYARAGSRHFPDFPKHRHRAAKQQQRHLSNYYYFCRNFFGLIFVGFGTGQKAEFNQVINKINNDPYAEVK
jgi:hypothetical protein